MRGRDQNKPGGWKTFLYRPLTHQPQFPNYCVNRELPVQFKLLLSRVLSHMRLFAYKQNYCLQTLVLKSFQRSVMQCKGASLVGHVKIKKKILSGYIYNMIIFVLRPSCSLRSWTVNESLPLFTVIYSFFPDIHLSHIFLHTTLPCLFWSSPRPHSLHLHL